MKKIEAIQLLLESKIVITNLLSIIRGIDGYKEEAHHASIIKDIDDLVIKYQYDKFNKRSKKIK